MNVNEEPGQTTTNREDNSTKFECVVGIDTIRLAGAVSRAEVPTQRIRRSVDIATGVFADQVVQEYGRLECGVYLNVAPGPDGLIAVVEASVPRLLSGNNLYPASKHTAVRVAHRLHDEASTIVRWLDGPLDLQVRRMDLVRDFAQVDDIAGLLAALHAQPTRHRGIVTHVYGKGHPETLTREVRRSWRASLYDKHSQMLATIGEAPEEALGQVRFEVALRSRTLRRAGLHRVRDMTKIDFEETALKYFRRAGYNATTGGLNMLQRSVERMQQHADYKSIAPILGTLLVDQLGAPHGASSATVAKYRSMAARHRLFVPCPQSSSSRFLDFFAGQVIERNGFDSPRSYGWTGEDVA